MAARICDACVVNWPSLNRFQSCPVCGGATKNLVTRTPDFTETEAVAYAREEKARLERLEREAAERGATSPAHQNRVDRYLALGFSEVDAQVLALSTRVHVDSVGRQWIRHVNHLDVARALASMLAKGYEDAQARVLALEIFS